MKSNFLPVGKLIDGSEKSIVKTLSEMISIKAISPQNGGNGEAKRADFLQKTLEGWGFKVKRYDYSDKTKTKRPNLVVKFGKNSETIWIISHIDTVPEGDRSLWHTDPFKAKVTLDKVYGRGTNDDGQGVVASMFALKALKDSNARLRYNMGVALVADEETGSEYGLKRLLKERIFKKGDMFIVPDSGSPKGDDIEINEKGVLWLKVTVEGKQTHASAPQRGENAYRNAIKFLNTADVFLHKKYHSKDKLFGSRSTFEMTKHEKNVDSINIVPGMDVSYMDCRILPKYSPDHVLKDIRDIAKRKEFKKVKINVDVAIRLNAADPTPENSKIIKALKDSLKALRGINAKCVGIGGFTVAKEIRKLGSPVAVWSTMSSMAHQANEYTRIRYMVEDAKVFAYLCV
jgi:succinyl-diaminopimelate desuccinylase